MSASVPRTTPPDHRVTRAATGIPGLDSILKGGLPSEHLYLIQGDPGSGKTTMALQFLRQGVEAGERCLYVTLSESTDELNGIAASHGWTLDGIETFELTPKEESLQPDGMYTVFHPSEVELSDTLKALFAEVDEVRPSRVVIDSLSELRLLARDALRYKRQILSLKHFFLARRATALLLDDRTTDSSDLHVQSSAHGVILMEQLTPEYGVERRRLRVMKLRGASYRGGYHDYMIETGGLSVFPRLVAAEHRAKTTGSAVSSGVGELDELFGGGVERGTSTLIMGPAGSGKSTIALRFAVESALRGEKAAMYNFDEGPQTLRDRARSLGMDLDGLVESGLIGLEHIDPAELSPGEFVQRVCAAVLCDDRKLVVIDTLNGFLNAMPGEKYLTIQLHELLTFLGSHGVVTILVLSQYGVLGSSMQTPVDVSYLADSVLLVRYFEHEGAVKLALSAVKKRSGKHERTIREFDLGTEGIRVGKPLSNLHGVLTGVPTITGYSNGNSELLPASRDGNG